MCIRDRYYKELAKDIEQTEQETDYTQFTGWDFNGGYAAINTDANYPVSYTHLYIELSI